MKKILLIGITFFALSSQAAINCPAYVIKGLNYLDDKSQWGAVLTGDGNPVDINGEKISLSTSRDNDILTINMSIGTDWIWTVLKESDAQTKANYEYNSSFYDWPGAGLTKFDFINPIERNGFGYLQLTSSFVEVLRRNNLYGLEPFTSDRISNWDLVTATEYIQDLLKKGIVKPEQLLFFGPADFCWEK